MATTQKSDYLEPPHWVSETSMVNDMSLEEREELNRESSKSPTTPKLKGLPSSPTIYWTRATEEKPSRIRLWIHSLWPLYKK